VFSKNKRVCPNRSNKTTTTNNTTSSNANNHPFYSKKVGSIKPKMSNLFELLVGSIADILRKYEILSNIISEYNGKVHGSQLHIVAANNSIKSLIVYYEIPEGQRDEVKQRLKNYILTVNSS
jgi:hypothetical protein